MITHVKTFMVDNPLDIEKVLNEWLKEQGDIEVGIIYPTPLVQTDQVTKEQRMVFMFFITYRKEGWK